MKKIFMAMAFCLMCITSFAQDWDDLSKYRSDAYVVHDWNLTTYYDVMHIKYVYKDTIFTDISPSGEVTSYSDKFIDESMTKYEMVASIPYQIWDDYKIGDNCFNSGMAFISLGGIIGVVGGITYGAGIKNNNVVAIKSGVGMMSAGSTLIGISVPLLCFGDNMKRACNREYRLYSSLK